MSSSRKVWIPGGVPPEAEMALSVEASGKPITPALYRLLLARKLDSLIQADPQAARSALEMSQEQAPELWAIAEQYPMGQWGSAIVGSDLMMALLGQMAGPGRLGQPEPPQSLREVIELLA